MIVTNNSLVRDRFEGWETVFVEGDCLDVFKAARDRIHLGHRLLSHPLSGSVKPGQTPYKTIVITKEKDTLDERSLSMIEESIQAFVRLNPGGSRGKYTKEVLDDFRLIDYNLVYKS